MPFSSKISITKQIVFSNLWISFGAVCLTLNFYVLNNIKINTSLLYFVFFTTLFSYNFQRLIKIKLNINLKGERVEWIMVNQKSVLLITSIALLGSVYFGFEFILEFWAHLTFIGVLTFFYVWKIPGLNGKSLRDIPTLKIFIIAFVWVLFCVIFPYLVENRYLFTQRVIIDIISTFMLMVSITIPFDVRDMKLDKHTTKTIPQIIGETKARYLSIILFLLSEALIVYNYPNLMYSSFIFIVVSVIILNLSKQTNKEIYFSGLVDSILVIKTLIILLFKFVTFL